MTFVHSTQSPEPSTEDWKRADSVNVDWIKWNKMKPWRIGRFGQGWEGKAFFRVLKHTKGFDTHCSVCYQHQPAYPTLLCLANPPVFSSSKSQCKNVCPQPEFFAPICALKSAFACHPGNNSPIVYKVLKSTPSLPLECWLHGDRDLPCRSYLWS